MSSSEEIPLSKLPMSIENPSNPIKRQAKYAAKNSFCLVCQDHARIVNYGALSCSSCKTFFRRHGFRIEKVEPCRFQGNCDINLRARRVCAACRLAKCLAVGMSPDLIRKEDLSERHSYSRNFLKKPFYSRPYPLDLLNQDRSSLSTTDWRLFSNIIHAYDSLSPAHSTRNEIARQSTLPMKIRLKFAQDFIPNLVISFYTSLQAFIQCTNEFRSLNKFEQMCLYQRNFHSITSLTGQLILRDSGMLDSPAFLYAFASLYDVETLTRADKISRRLDHDSTLVKIFLILIAFSTNCFLIHQGESFQEDLLVKKTKLLFHYQNLYTELLWKYMIFRYNYREAACRFSGLIKQILDLIPLAVDAYVENSTHQLLVEDITIKTQSMMNINEK